MLEKIRTSEKKPEPKRTRKTLEKKQKKIEKDQNTRKRLEKTQNTRKRSLENTEEFWNTKSTPVQNTSTSQRKDFSNILYSGVWCTRVPQVLRTRDFANGLKHLMRVPHKGQCKHTTDSRPKPTLKKYIRKHIGYVVCDTGMAHWESNLHKIA